MCEVERKIHNNTQASNPITNNEQEYLPVSHHLRNLRILKNLAKMANKKLAPKWAMTLFNMLWNDKDSLMEQECKEVYRIPIREVQTNQNAAYALVTTRTLKKRIEEHKKNIAKAKLTTSLAVEAFSKDIEISWNQVKIIKLVPPHTQPVIMESLQIVKRKDSENLINNRIAWDLAQA